MQRLVMIFILCLAFLSQSCSKKVVAVLPLPPKTLTIEEIDFEYMHGKARLNYKDEKKQLDVKATIRIRKDSLIWMTFSVIGVQGGKALINRDSITIVSSVDKEYYVFNYGELSQRFNFKIDFSVVQAAMLGNLIIPRRADDQLSDDGDFTMLNQKLGTGAIRNFINRSTKKLEKMQLTDSVTNNFIKIDYSNFQPLGNKSFPYTGTISVQYKTVAGIINHSITFDYIKAEVGDKELRFPFNFPKRYERR